MDVVYIWFWTLFGAAVWWLWSCHRLFGRMRSHHPQLYERMGRPALIGNNRPIHSIRLLRFLYGQHDDTLNDDWVFSLRARMRVVGIFYLAGFIGLIAFFAVVGMI